MSTFIFCLIFIQVSVFLIAGIALVTTFYTGLTRHASGPEKAAAEVKSAPQPDLRPARSFCLADAALTRSELDFLLEQFDFEILQSQSQSARSGA